MTPRERLFALEQFGIKLGLGPVNTLLEALSRPDAAWPSVHVAGTNGKGSVAAMVERGLRAAGYRTGRYTSPHLHRIEERIAIDGEPVDAATFDTAARDVMALIDRLLADRSLPAWPTFFEATTVLAFEMFRRARVSAAVIEVGLGGRFDATNAVMPRVSVITPIALDHERHLGGTLSAIAFQKAGIAKRGVPLVVGALTEPARSVVAAAAAEAGAPLVSAGDEHVTGVRLHRGRASVDLSTPAGSYRDLTLGLNGAHQVGNAVIAVRTLEVCRDHGLAIGADHIAAAVSQVHWPARLEWLRLPSERLVLIDAAHNPSGADALAAYLRSVGVAPAPVILGVMRDKDVDGVIRAIAPVASRLLATQPDSPRALPAQALAGRMALTSPGTPADACADPHQALAAALADSPHAVVAGSIFLVGPLRADLTAQGAVPVPGPM
jgi:dihydrofolate synthase / folylpolyglutamate synthase